MKILSAKQIKALDAHTIAHEPIASIDLMERASRAFVDWFVTYIEVTNSIAIVCGTGNNGGDGLAIARMLTDRGYPVKVWIVRGSVPESTGFKINLTRVSDKVETQDIISESDSVAFDTDVIIDAVFGSGLSRPAEGIYAHVFRVINQADSLRIAVDIPSGLMMDGPSSGEIVKAHHTVSFQLPKLSFFLPQSFHFTGEWVLVDIRLKRDFIKSANTPYHYILQKDACKLLKRRSKFDHKGTFGHSLIIAGSYGKMGAAVLAARAALRSGTGLLTVHIPSSGYQILQVAVPEAMAIADRNENHFSNTGDLEKFTTIGIGPGLGQDSESVKGMSDILAKFRKPLVIDADGLNILSANPELQKLIPEGSILTPHPKEFERLAGQCKNDFERLEKQRQLSIKLRSIIALKGAYTSIAAPDGNIYFNSTGNPGMATGGTGDVLTGILTGLLAQSYTSVEAAILGVFLHGLAGDLAVREKGNQGLIASDLVDFVPFAYKKLYRE
jgi:NAD(P)H-hydrate epimerase